MNFSDIYSNELKQVKNQEWLDISSVTDVPLFIDPVLIKLDRPDLYKKIVSFFNDVFVSMELYQQEVDLKELQRIEEHIKDLLTFPEVNEVALGYSLYFSNGRGSGKEVANYMFDAIKNVSSHQYNHNEYLDGIQLFSLNMGEDRISDMIANILKEELISFTQEVCEKYYIPLETCVVKNAKLQDGQWVDIETELPSNSKDGKDKKFFILTPIKWLSDLPYSDMKHFKGYMRSYKNNYFKKQLSDDIMSSMKKQKQEFAEMLLSDKDLYYKLLNERKSIVPYDIKYDKNNIFLFNNILKDYIKDYDFDSNEHLVSESFNTFVEVMDIYHTKIKGRKLTVKKYRQIFFDIMLILINGNSRIKNNNNIDQRLPKTSQVKLIDNFESKESVLSFTIVKDNVDEFNKILHKARNNTFNANEYYLYIYNKKKFKDDIDDLNKYIKDNNFSNILVYGY